MSLLSLFPSSPISPHSPYVLRGYMFRENGGGIVFEQTARTPQTWADRGKVPYIYTVY